VNRHFRRARTQVRDALRSFHQPVGVPLHRVAPLVMRRNPLTQVGGDLTPLLAHRFDCVFYGEFPRAPL